MDSVNSITSNIQMQLPNSKDMEYAPLRGDRPLYGYNVSRAGDLPCRLTLFWGGWHSFVRLQNKARNVDMTRGFYPNWHQSMAGAHGQCLVREDDPVLAHDLPNADCQARQSSARTAKVGGGAASVAGSCHLLRKVPPLKLLASGSSAAHLLLRGWGAACVKGQIADENRAYRAYGGTASIPRVSFAISGQEALEVEKFLVEFELTCVREDSGCTYRVLGHNCIDFSQAVFAKTAYPGHFVWYFPGKMLPSGTNAGSVYAALSHPALSFANSVALSAVIVFHTIPKATSMLTSTVNWLADIVWPGETVDTESLKSRYGYVQACFYACEQFWDDFPHRNKTTQRLISASTDLQFRFLAIEKEIEQRLSARLGDTIQTSVHRELKEIEQGFRLFEKEVQGELAGRLDLTVEQP